MRNWVVLDDVGIDGLNRQRVNLWQGKNNVTFSWWGHRRSTRWNKAIRIRYRVVLARCCRRCLLKKSFVPELSIPPPPPKPSLLLFFFSARTRLSILQWALNFEGNMIKFFRFPSRLSKEIPTDTAVLRFAERSPSINVFSLDNTADVLPPRRSFEIFFNSRNKWMMSVIQDNTKTDSNGSESWKGTPDVLFPSATSILNAIGKPVPFDPAYQSRLSQLQHKWSSWRSTCHRSVQALSGRTQAPEERDWAREDVIQRARGSHTCWAY